MANRRRQNRNNGRKPKHHAVAAPMDEPGLGKRAGAGIRLGLAATRLWVFGTLGVGIAAMFLYYLLIGVPG